jgi:hypothetical protein
LFGDVGSCALKKLSTFGRGVVSLKYQWLFISRHGVRSQKTWIFKTTAASKVLICKPEGTNSPGISRRNIKMDIKEKWCDDVAWIHLAQNFQHLWPSANTVMFKEACSGPQGFCSIGRVVYLSVIIFIIIIIIIITVGSCYDYSGALPFQAIQICLFQCIPTLHFFSFSWWSTVIIGWKYGLDLSYRSSHHKKVNKFCVVVTF